MPVRLDGVDDHLAREFAARQRSAFSHIQMRTLLLSGSSVPASYGHFAAQAYPDFPNANKVERTAGAIEQYLGRLIAPDAVSDLREVMCEYLSFGELNETASLLAHLGELAPSAATALLELRVGRGHRLIKDRIQLAYLNRQDPSALENLMPCVAEIARIRIAYRLRSIATACAAQIHAPLKFPSLDELEQPEAAGNLRLHTLVKRMKAEIALTEKAFEIYARNHRRPLHHGVLRYSPVSDEKLTMLSFAEYDRPSPAAAVGAFRALGLEDRACVQLALWRAEHGDSFDAVLEHTITRLREVLADMKRRLDARSRSAGPNAIVGNLGRTNAGVKLHFAVEEAIAWTAEPISHAKSALADDWEAQLWRAPVINPIDAALNSLHSRRKSERDLPIPARARGHASLVAHVFMALRIAFLQDNEVLPLKLREMRDPITGKKTAVKTHDRAAQLRGRRYEFSEQWDAFLQKQKEKQDEFLQSQSIKRSAFLQRQENKGKPLPALLTQRSQAYQIDYDIKRAAHAIRNINSGRPPRDAFRTMLELRGAIVRGFLST